MRAATVAIAFSASPSWSASACRNGALASAWSRSVIISSLGESGFSVFQAGHCDWQRPHSVQVEKSSRPFQVKSSTAPTPSVEPSSSSSSASMSKGLPPIVSGLAAPSAVRPDDSRLNQMFGNARNRCHATPIVGCSEMVIIHAKEIRILTVATT